MDTENEKVVLEEDNTPINYDKVYDAIDAMEKMKKYKKPEEDYFPSLAEINTYINSDDKYMIPYLMWLDNNLSPEARKDNKEAIQALNKYLSEKMD